MKTTLQSTYGPAGTVSVWRTNHIESFEYGSGQTADQAYEAASKFRDGHRRAERCSIWIQSAAEGSVFVELSPAGEAEPAKTPKGDHEPKTGSSRKERRAKKKRDILAVRERIQQERFAKLGVDAIVDEDAIIRRESFKEVRARLSRVTACRVTTWKAKGTRLVTGLGVAAFR
jgi:hypothetical protein